MADVRRLARLGPDRTRARNMVRSPHQRPYMKVASNGRDTIHFAFTQGHPARGNRDIYYARYRRGSFQRADGGHIDGMSSLPIGLDEADLVHNGARRSWIHDIAIGARGRPVMVYASFASRREHYYWYARWNGRRWLRYRFTPAGRAIDDSGDEPWYSGGITLDHENPSVVYLSRQVGPTHEVQLWRTPSGGSRWRRSRVTYRSGIENVRPISPRGLRGFGGDMSVLFMRGRYHHYVDYETSITTRLLNGGNLQPAAAARDAIPTGSAPGELRFDASPASDPDGTIVDHTWDFGDGTGTRGRAPTHRYLRPGRYFPRLTVTDDGGDRDVFVEQVEVDPSGG